MDYFILCLFWALLTWLVWKACKALSMRQGLRTPIYTMLTALMVWGGLKIGWVPGAGVYHDLSMTNQLFGKRFLLGDPSFSHHTQRSFHGDGFSMTVYSLSEAQVRYLREAGPELSAHPAGLHYRNRWQKVSWKHSPMRKDETRYLDFCRSWTSGIESKVTEVMDQMESALTGRDCLYSYNYQEHGGTEPWLSDVDFYFVDLERRLFIMLNQQT